MVSAIASKLGLAKVISEKIDLLGRVGGDNPASKSLTLFHAMVAGASHIDHVDMLRAGASAKVPPFSVVAPSTLGTYLCSFTFGLVRQLDNVIKVELAKAWSLGMAPGDDPLVIDIDSTICEVSGYHKQGATYGYTKRLGYHPILAVRSDTGEVLALSNAKRISQYSGGEPSASSKNSSRGIDERGPIPRSPSALTLGINQRRS